MVYGEWFHCQILVRNNKVLKTQVVAELWQAQAMRSLAWAYCNSNQPSNWLIAEILPICSDLFEGLTGHQGGLRPSLFSLQRVWALKFGQYTHVTLE